MLSGLLLSHPQTLDSLLASFLCRVKLIFLSWRFRQLNNKWLDFNAFGLRVSCPFTYIVHVSIICLNLFATNIFWWFYFILKISTSAPMTTLKRYAECVCVAFKRRKLLSWFDVLSSFHFISPHKSNETEKSLEDVRHVKINAEQQHKIPLKNNSSQCILLLNISYILDMLVVMLMATEITFSRSCFLK